MNLKKALIVNSQDGLDEISPYANTDIVELNDGKITEFVLNPKDLGIKAKVLIILLEKTLNIMEKR